MHSSWILSGRSPGRGFVGGLLAVFLAVSIPRIIGKNSIVMLVLSGIIVSGLTGSLWEL